VFGRNENRRHATDGQGEYQVVVIPSVSKKDNLGDNASILNDKKLTQLWVTIQALKYV